MGMTGRLDDPIIVAIAVEITINYKVIIQIERVITT